MVHDVVVVAVVVVVVVEVEVVQEVHRRAGVGAAHRVQDAASRIDFSVKHYKGIKSEPDGAGGGTVLVCAASGALALGIGRQAAEAPGEYIYEI